MWEKELQYIKSVISAADFLNFNQDINCFGRYVEMQAKQAYKEGFYSAAKQLREVNPAFQTCTNCGCKVFKTDSYRIDSCCHKTHLTL